MYPASFDYHRASSIDEAIALLEEYEEAELLSGGQSLVPLQKNRLATPDQLVDLNPIEEIEYIEEREDHIRVGALARHDAVQHHEAIREHVYLMSETIGQIADQQVRNQGTVGGTIAEADPSGDYFPPLKLLQPEIVVNGPEGQRTASFEDFYLGMFMVDLDEAELITEIRVPKLTPHSDAAGVGSAYRKHARRSGDYAIAGVASILHVADDGVVVDANIAVGSVGPLFRAEEAETSVEGTALGDSALEQAEEAVTATATAEEGGPEGAYREEMAGVFTKKSLTRAYERAMEGV